MAKRKRLTPARPELFSEEGVDKAASEPEMTARFSPYPDKPEPRRSSPPIADVAGVAAAEAAVAEMAETLRLAREQGRLVLSLACAEIDTDYLVRDRIAVDQAEMTTLVESIRARGQQTPIEVAQLANGRYGLISGWRRMQALEQLAAASDTKEFDTVKALLRRPEQSSDAYLAMVEENEIRVGLSYYERARIAVRAVEQRVFDSEKAALLCLYHAASRSKRSKIRSFLSIVRGLDGGLKFPEALPERFGLTLAKALEQDPALAPRLQQALQAASPANAEAEMAILTAGLKSEKPAVPGEIESIIKLSAGLQLRTHRNGSLTLSGKSADARLRQRLMNWLATQN